MDDPYELWMWVWLGLILLLWIGVVLFSAWVDSRRPQRFSQRDWVAEHKRKLARNGFKSRMGVK